MTWRLKRITIYRREALSIEFSSVLYLINSGALGSYLQVAAQFREEGDWGARLQVGVQVLLELGGHDPSEVGEDTRGNVDLAQHVHLQK